jgi:hypothetical protein
MSGLRDLLRSCVLPYAVKYAVNAGTRERGREEACGQARCQGRPEENAQAYAL